MTGGPTPATRPAALVAASLVAALLLAGCPGPDNADVELDSPPEEPAPPIDPAPPPDPDDDVDVDAGRLAQQCTNPEFGFQVQYPEGWMVNEGNGLPPCSAFDPEATAMPAVGDIPRDIAVTFHRDRVAFQRATDFQGDIGVDPLSREATTVDGRRAVVAELESTGGGMYPAGQTQYVYYVDADPYTLMARTHDIPAAAPPSYQARQRILDRMMESLRFTEGS
jgi:hypothetical protein